MKGTGVLDDTEIMELIRRANLDSFWSREPVTICHNLTNINRVLQIAHELGRDKPLFLFRDHGLWKTRLVWVPRFFC
jgi:hypothetical protein